MLHSLHDAFQVKLDQALATFRSSRLLTLTGPSGCGKSYLAEAFHREMPEAREPFISQDAAGLAEARFESQLFGHVRGAFSGATHPFSGLVGAVGKGTLLLEGIEDFSLGAQARLLRFLQDRRYRQVGSTHEHGFQGRIILTSRYPLMHLLEQQLLREDFYHRISATETALPGLAARPDDFPALAEAVLSDLEAQLPGFPRPPAEQLADLSPNDFDGNLHGLRNLLQQAMLLGQPPKTLLARATTARATDLPRTGSFKSDLAELERRLLVRALEELPITRAELAAHLGISRRALIYKLKEHGLLDLH